MASKQPEPNAHGIMYSDLAPDGEKRARRIIYRHSKTYNLAVDIVMQWKRFLSQERYSEETIAAIDTKGLRLLMARALEAPFITKDPILREVAAKLEAAVQVFVLGELRTVDCEGMFRMLRFRGRSADSFEIDIKVALGDDGKYADIDAVCHTFDALLQPQSGTVHDVSFEDSGITFWHSFELPILHWAAGGPRIQN